MRYQGSCFRYLWRRAGEFDIIVSQELLRGSLNACLIGCLFKKPVVIYITLPHLEYFRCRRLRGQQSWLQATVGEAVMRGLIWTTSKLATRCVAIGPYLVDVVSRHSSRVSTGYYYGVDTEYYRPADKSEKARLRTVLDLPAGKFLSLAEAVLATKKIRKRCFAPRRWHGLKGLMPWC